jgi:hypothetical protein
MQFARVPAAILVLGTLFLSSFALASTPTDVVQQLYAEPGLAFGGSGSQDVLSADLQGALHAAAGRVRGSSPVDFDYRYGFKQTEISGLQLLPQIDNDEAKVVAVFKNFGRPESVNWLLCRTPDGGWRVADASSVTGPEAWDLRRILGLRPDQVSC